MRGEKSSLHLREASLNTMIEDSRTLSLVPELSIGRICLIIVNVTVLATIDVIRWGQLVSMLLYNCFLYSYLIFSFSFSPYAVFLLFSFWSSLLLFYFLQNKTFHFHLILIFFQILRLSSQVEHFISVDSLCF